MEEFYPMPMFVSLDVVDLTASADWYRRALGFRVLYRTPDESPALVHLRREKYQDLLLHPARHGAPAQPAGGIVIQFQAGSVTVEDIARQAKLAADTRVEGPVERPWNVRDVTIIDPDGYRLRFSEPVDEHLSFYKVIAQKGKWSPR
jgi:catechol 2,3-dioxygenase-like lactoylglutathione lyase family enzyme